MNVRQTPKFINTPAIFQVDDLLVRAWENKQTNGQRSHHRRITLSEYNALRKEVGRLGDELTRGGGDTAKLEQDEARLKDLTTQLEDQKRNVHFRITKLRRKKEWKKRRQEECKLKREEGIMRRKQLDEQTETWIQDRRLLDSLFEEDDLAVKELEQRINRQQASSEKEEGMDRLIRQLEELRALRRAKRKLAGETFPEEDAEFFDRIREEEIGQLPQDASEPQFLEHTDGKGLWTLNRLIGVRREWDRFVVPEGTPGAGRIPTGWPLPPPYK